jgi:hypothetical protein
MAHGPLGVDSARSDLGLELCEQLLIFEHEQVRIEYVGVLRAQLARELGLYFLELCAGFGRGLAQSLYFGADLRWRDFHVVKLASPALIEPERAAYGHSGRGRQA